jgi:hypothetical protein
MIAGKQYEITPPRRRIYAAEVAAEMGQRPMRAFIALAGLGLRELWAQATEPKYPGRVDAYAEDVLEALPAHSVDDLILAGIDVWKVWLASQPQAKAVQEAKDFTAADAVQSSASVG